MKGSAYVYLVVLVLFFVVLITYNFFSEPFILVHNEVSEFINETANSTAKERAESTMNILTIVWQYWPILFLFFLMIWAIVAAQKREPYEVVE